MFKEISIQDIKLNPITGFGKDWMTLTAGNKENNYNVMTVAWGQFGSLWERGSHSNRLPTAICYVRPGRYTKEFMDREDFFTLSHFGSAHKEALAYLGTHSGRNGDKIKGAGLTPVFVDGLTYFEEAKTVYICHKLYHASLVPWCYVKKKYKLNVNFLRDICYFIPLILLSSPNLFDIAFRIHLVTYIHSGYVF